MPDPIAPIARRAAARLADRLDPKLPALTERALAGGEDTMRSYDAGVTLALAAFLLSAVQFGWKVYRDIKEDREKKDQRDSKDRKDGEEGPRQLQTVLVRRLRIGLTEAPRGLPAEQRDHILEVVAEEILAVGEIWPPA
jgi:hypothetical protein